MPFTSACGLKQPHLITTILQLPTCLIATAMPKFCLHAGYLPCPHLCLWTGCKQHGSDTQYLSIYLNLSLSDAHRLRTTSCWLVSSRSCSQWDQSACLPTTSSSPSSLSSPSLLHRPAPGCRGQHSPRRNIAASVLPSALIPLFDCIVPPPGSPPSRRIRADCRNGARTWRSAPRCRFGLRTRCSASPTSPSAAPCLLGCRKWPRPP